MLVFFNVATLSPIAPLQKWCLEECQGMGPSIVFHACVHHLV